MVEIYSYNVEANQTDVSPEFVALSLDKQRTQFLDAIGKSERALSSDLKAWNDRMIPVMCYVSGAFGSGSTTLTVDDVTNIYANTIINVSNQQYKVTSISGSNLTVSYVGGESRADVASGTKAYILGSARVEGSDFSANDYLQSFATYNYTQIFKREIKLSSTQLASIQEYNPQTLLAVEMEKSLAQVKLELASACVKGIPDSGSLTAPRYMGGIEYYVKTYGYAPSATTWDSGSNFNSFLNDMVSEHGARGVDLWMSATTKQNFKNLNKDRIIYLQDSGKAGFGIEQFEADNGTTYNLRVDPNFTSKKIYLVDTPSLILKVLRGFTSTELGQTGSNKKYLLEGEMGLVVPNVSTMGVFTLQ